MKKNSKYISGVGAALPEVEKLLQDIIDLEKMYAGKQKDEGNKEEEKTKSREFEKKSDGRDEYKRRREERETI